MAIVENTPAVRFKGFDEEWEVKKLGECVLIQRGGSPRPIENFITNASDGINWIKIGDVAQGSRYIKSTAEKIIPEGEKKSRRVYKGDLILSNSMSFGRPYILDIDGCIHDGWLLIRDDKKIFNLEYLLQVLSSSYTSKQYKSLASGGVVNNLNSELVQSTQTLIPPLQEQTKIGIYFKELEGLTQLHEQKLEKVTNLKKAMLEKMFPKDGADVPEIRFKGFTEKWKRKQLLKFISKIIDFRGRTPKKLGLEWSDNGYLALSALNVKNGFIDKSIDAHYGDEKLYHIWMNGNELHKGQVIFTTEAPMGNVARIPDDEKYILSQRTIAFEVEANSMREDFLSVLLSTPKSFDKLTSLSSGGTAKGVSQKSLANFTVMAPNDKEEQQRIGEYFQSFDEIINQSQQKIEQLNHLKQALLQKMFI